MAQFRKLRGRAAVQDDTVLVHFFLQGLTPERLRTACLTRGPTTLQEAIEVATRLEPVLGGNPGRGGSDRSDREQRLRCYACGTWKDANSRCPNSSCPTRQSHDSRDNRDNRNKSDDRERNVRDSNKAREDKPRNQSRGFGNQPRVNFGELDDLPEEDESILETEEPAAMVEEERQAGDF